MQFHIKRGLKYGLIFLITLYLLVAGLELFDHISPINNEILSIFILVMTLLPALLPGLLGMSQESLFGDDMTTPLASHVVGYAGVAVLFFIVGTIASFMVGFFEHKNTLEQ